MRIMKRPNSALALIHSLILNTMHYVFDQQNRNESAHFSLGSLKFTHVSDLWVVDIHSRDGAQPVLQHNCLRGNHPKGGEAAEVLVAFKQKPAGEKNATSSEEDDGSIQFSFFFPFHAGGSPSYEHFLKLNFTPGDGLNPRGQPWAQTYTSTYLRWSGSLVDMPTPSAYRMQLAWLKVNVAGGSLNPTAKAWGEESISVFRLSAWRAQEMRRSAVS